MNEQMPIATARARNKRRRFNAVDAVLILIILLVVSVCISVFLPTSLLDLFGGSSVNLEYMVEIPNVPTELAEKLETGGYTLIDAEGETALGTVELVDATTPYTVLTYNEAAGAAVLTEYPGRCNVQITVLAKANYRPGSGYTVNGYRIAVGEMMSVRCADFTGNGSCISVMQRG